MPASEPARSPAEVFWACLADRDLAGAFAAVDEDAEVTIVPAGIRGGAAAARVFFASTLAAFPDLLVTTRSSFTGIDGVTVTEVRLEGTQAAAYLGVLNQEKHVDIAQAWLLAARNGRIHAITGYWCQNQLYRRLAVKRLDQVAIIEEGAWLAQP